MSAQSLVAAIKRVGKQFRHGRQEDAHEYLRQLLDCMHEEVLKANNVKLSDKKAETTFISRIFGGCLCNELKCDRCKYTSRTYNHFQDLSLEVSGGISSVNDALRAFVKPEKLTHGNEWKCDGCKQRVLATKKLSISDGPNVLVLHLKRFSYRMGKITKSIQFDPVLEVPCDVPEAAEGGGGGGGGTRTALVRYELAGVVVHHGDSSHSGHYVAFVKAPNGNWYEMNDTHVSSTTLQNVLKQKAYILFYSKASLQHSANRDKGLSVVGKTLTSSSASSSSDAAALALGQKKGGNIKMSVSTTDILHGIETESDIGVAVDMKRAPFLPAASASATSGFKRSVAEISDDDDEDEEADEYDEDEEEGHSGSRKKALGAKFRLRIICGPRKFRFPFLTLINRVHRFTVPEIKRRRYSPRETFMLEAAAAAEKMLEKRMDVVDGGDYKNRSSSGSIGGSKEGIAEVPRVVSSNKRPRSESDHEAQSESEEDVGEPVKKQQQPAPKVFSQSDIIRLGARSKDTALEGSWDGVSKSQIAKRQQESEKRERMEQQELQRRQPGLIDQSLDKGRVKKVKTSKVEDTGLRADMGSKFQGVLDDRRSGKDSTRLFYDGVDQGARKLEKSSSGMSNRERHAAAAANASGGRGGGKHSPHNHGRGGGGHRGSSSGGRGGGRGSGGRGRGR